MKMQFEFDGGETPEQLAAISAAINAYCGKVFMSAGVIEAGPPQAQVMPMSASDVAVASQIFSDPEPALQIVPTEAEAVKVFEEITPVAEELDAAGKPWDESIHASSRAKTADGCWKFKRGIDPALRQGGMVVQCSSNDTNSAPVQSAIVAQSEPSVVPPPPPPAQAAEAHTLPWLMGQAAKHQKTKADIDAALIACGLRTIPDLLGQLDKMDDVARALGVL